jgi:SAM-dependent methyltransferase
MKKDQTDAYGRMLLEQLETGADRYEIIERDDDFIDTGSSPGRYFTEFTKWEPPEKKAIKHAAGRILDIGCGAGRHSIYLQEKGFDVTGIDISPGAVKVCKSRGLKKVHVRGVGELDKFRPRSFDTILMMVNNFGLIGGAGAAPGILKEMARITGPDGRIIAGTRNPYSTARRVHLDYHRRNRGRGRMAGQLRIRVRFATSIGEWFDYLLASPDELEKIVKGSGWYVDRFFGEEKDTYFALLAKESG